jgi:circadian clock protein KaiC
MAAAARGANSSVLLFDESIETHLTRSRGLGLDVAGAIEQGRVRLTHLDPAEMSVGQIADMVIRQVEAYDVKVVVIDTLNGYLQSAMEEQTVTLHIRELISYLSRRGVATLLTLTQHGILGPEMATPVDLSFLSDNVFLLRYFEAQGAIRKAISMVKKRSGKHEHTIRELIFRPGGVDVGNALDDFTGVLTGTPVYVGAKP